MVEGVQQDIAKEGMRLRGKKAKEGEFLLWQVTSLAGDLGR
jgi:hypothetical protein